MDNIQEKEKPNPTDVELCHRAILLYLESFLPFSGKEDNEERKAAREYDASQNAKYLATKPYGLRIGAPGWPDAKLYWEFRYPHNNEKAFRVEPNGMDEKRYEKWREFIAKRFENAGLRFYNPPPRK
jgi:hypothetical protein